MPKLVVAQALLACNKGTLPSALVIADPRRPKIGDAAIALVGDHVPNVNVMPFGMCSSLQNPAVQTATTAAQGTLTPMACIPVLTDPWSPGIEDERIGDVKILDDGSTCRCKWNGTIEVQRAGQDVVESA
jgi:hypothetical protein